MQSQKLSGKQNSPLKHLDDLVKNELEQHQQHFLEIRNKFQNNQEAFLKQYLDECLKSENWRRQNGVNLPMKIILSQGEYETMPFCEK